MKLKIALLAMLVGTAGAWTAAPDKTEADFKKFAGQFVLQWAKSEKIHEKSKLTCKVLDIDEVQTKSKLHPVVWVLTASSTEEWHDGMEADSVHFKFYWDGKRWVGLESDYKMIAGIGLPQDSEEHKIAAVVVDKIATATQKDSKSNKEGR